MARFTNPLDRVRIAAPCTADWNRMTGDGRVRFCSQCNLNVYNLSGMTRGEAEALLIRTEGRLCIRFYRRRDGSILTGQCPVGLRALKARAGRAARAVVSSVLGFFAGVGLYSAAPSEISRPSMGAIVASDQKPPVQPSVRPDVEMGEPILGRMVVLDDDIRDVKADRPIPKYRTPRRAKR